MKLTRLAVATVLATAAMAANAEITISPMVGYQWYDSNTNPADRDDGLELDNDLTYSLALGYRVTPNVGLELRYGQGRTEIDADDNAADGVNVRAETATLDTYYRFNADGMLQPYVLVGGGLQRYTADNRAVDNSKGWVEQTIANAAVGAFVQLTDNIALRAEARGVQNLQESNTDGIASVGLLVGFGGSKAAAVAPVAPAATDGDDDKDGVLNSVDKCPGTPSTLVVDADGCPKVLTETVSKEIRVLFDTNKSTIKTQYDADIEAVAKLMTDYPTAKVEIQGHTDSRGSADYNQKLSESRAAAVVKVLTDKYGIAADRISSVGYGAAQPVADNKTVEGRAQNRRTMAVAAGEVKVTVKK